MAWVCILCRSLALHVNLICGIVRPQKKPPELFAEGPMKREAISSTTVLLFAALSCASVWGQATAQIGGTVRDQSGAVLPGVEVTATQTETGITRNTVTNETGSYVLPNLATGPYRI